MRIQRAIKNIPFLVLTPIFTISALLGKVLGMEFSFWCLISLVLSIILFYFFRKITIYPTVILLGAGLMWVQHSNDITLNKNLEGKFVITKNFNNVDYSGTIIEADSKKYSNYKTLIIKEKRYNIQFNEGDTVTCMVNVDKLKNSNLNGKLRYGIANIYRTKS